MNNIRYILVYWKIQYDDLEGPYYLFYETEEEVKRQKLKLETLSWQVEVLDMLMIEKSKVLKEYVYYHVTEDITTPESKLKCSEYRTFTPMTNGPYTYFGNEYVKAEDLEHYKLQYRQNPDFVKVKSGNLYVLYPINKVNIEEGTYLSYQGYKCYINTGQPVEPMNLQTDVNTSFLSYKTNASGCN